MIYVKTGEGGNKTTSAMGLALRALGNNKRVVIVQFMKGRFTGEREALKRFSNCDFKQFGREDFINFNNVLAVDKRLANQALNYAFKSLKHKPFLLILDEVNLACAMKLIKVKDVLSLIKQAGAINVVLTGRRAPKSFIKIADFVTEYTDLKRRAVKARAGIEY